MMVLQGEEVITLNIRVEKKDIKIYHQKSLDMIRPYLRDLMNDHKPTTELNNNDERGEWKIQLVMQNNCISTRNADTGPVYSASKPVEIFMGNDTKDVIDRLFYTLLQIFQQAIEHQIIMEADLLMKMLLYCIIIL